MLTAQQMQEYRFLTHLDFNKTVFWEMSEDQSHLISKEDSLEYHIKENSLQRIWKYDTVEFKFDSLNVFADRGSTDQLLTSIQLESILDEKEYVLIFQLNQAAIYHMNLSQRDGD